MNILHFGHYGKGSESWGGIESHIATLIKKMGSHTVVNLVSNDNFSYKEEKFYAANIVKSPRIFKLFSTSFCPFMPIEAKKLHEWMRELPDDFTEGSRLGFFELIKKIF